MIFGILELFDMLAGNRLSAERILLAMHTRIVLTRMATRMHLPAQREPGRPRRPMALRPPRDAQAQRYRCSQA